MIGKTVTHYRVVDRIGSGGMGVVYRAEDLRLSREVALKFLPTDHAADRVAVERFLREARTASALNHPNICTIYEIDEHEGSQFIAMELLDGQPMDRLIGGKPLEVGRLLDLGVQIADALDAAHGRGILHRDIKPSNIFVTSRDQAKVLDFGLAKWSGADGGGLDVTSAQTGHLLTTKGSTLGTILYMSPEQARGEELDARSDLFSFGVTLYEMATGRQTFQGSTSAVVFDAILNRDPVPLQELNANVPPELTRIISRTIEKDRRYRYQSAADLRAELQRMKRDRESRPFSSSGSSLSSSASELSGFNSAGSASPSGMSMRVAAVPLAAPSEASVNQVTMPPAPKVRRTVSLSVSTVVALFAVVALAGLTVAMGPWRNGAAVPAATGAGETVATPATEVAPPTTSPDAADAVNPADVKPVLPASIAAKGTVATPLPTPAGSGAPSKPAGGAPGTTAGSAAGAGPGVTAAPGATDVLKAAQAKFDDRRDNEALEDIRLALGEKNVANTTASAAYLLMARIYSRQGRSDDAIGALGEVRTRDRSGPSSAEATFMMASLVLRSKQRDRDDVAYGLLDEIPKNYPQSSFAPEALAAKAVMEERRKLRVFDPVLNTNVPAELVSYRTLASQYPQSASTPTALQRLADMYDEIKRYTLAAESLEALAASSPSQAADAWWLAGEMWEKKAREATRARDAYARVPPAAKRYKDAQEQLRRLGR